MKKHLINLNKRLSVKGINLVGFNPRLIISNKNNNRGYKNNVSEYNVLHQSMVRYIHNLIEKYPSLEKYNHEVISKNFDSARALLSFLNNYVPIIDKDSQEAYTRTLLSTLKSQCNNKSYAEYMNVLIAQSNFNDGVIDRAMLLYGREEVKGYMNEFNEMVSAHEIAYGAKIITEYSAKKPNLTGIDVRGNSLIEYFSKNIKLLQGKNVLHISPNKVLDNWFKRKAPTLKMNYKTLNLFPGCDYLEDITRMKLEDGQFDLVVNHRVLEHISDDRSAIKECHRILKKGGILNVSVPQSMNQNTKEWNIQDISHDEHVRQYGKDFEDKLNQNGFTVSVVTDLLAKEINQHFRDNTYPMRFYNCYK
ncbi:MAG: methyltransferase domain-containing protein [Flavobacteriales bacterium]|nr:methyltransferase domain-containing protein [Flavobacteriales bacterium]